MTCMWLSFKYISVILFNTNESGMKGIINITSTPTPTPTLFCILIFLTFRLFNFFNSSILRQTQDMLFDLFIPCNPWLNIVYQHMNIIKVYVKKFIFLELFLGIIIIIVSRYQEGLGDRRKVKIQNDKFKINIYVYLSCTIFKKDSISASNDLRMTAINNIAL